MYMLKRVAIYDNDAGFSGTIKTRGLGFVYITKILITLSVLLTIFMLVLN